MTDIDPDDVFIVGEDPLDPAGRWEYNIRWSRARNLATRRLIETTPGHYRAISRTLPRHRAHTELRRTYPDTYRRLFDQACAEAGLLTRRVQAHLKPPD